MKAEDTVVPPVDTFIAEHKKIPHFAEELAALAQPIKPAKDFNRGRVVTYPPDPLS